MRYTMPTFVSGKRHEVCRLESGTRHAMDALVSGRRHTIAMGAYPEQTGPPPGPVLPAWVTHAWEAESLSALSDGDPVTTWTDSVASVAMTSSGTNRPFYRAGTPPYVDFDGVDDWLASTLGSAQPNSIFMAVKSAVLTPTQSVFFDGATGNRHLLFEFTGNRLWTVVTAALDSGLAAPSAPSLIGARYSGATSQAYRDASAGPLQTHATTALAGFRLGASASGTAPLNGEIYAVFVGAGHSVTPAEILALRQYCVDKSYGNPAP